MSITKHPASYKEAEEIKALGKDPKGMNHRARSLYSLHTVNTKHKLGKDMIYCVPEKTGISNWQRFNMLVRDNLKSTLFSNRPRVKEKLKNDGLNIGGNQLYSGMASFERKWFDCQSRSMKAGRCNEFNYWKKQLFSLNNDSSVIRMINVRHPFARLKSAHADKMNALKSSSSIKYFSWYQYYIKTVKGFEDKETMKTKERGDQISFLAFLKGLAYEPADMYNKHWSPIVSICEPCLIDYDVITKTETMDNDYLLVQKLWNEKLIVPGFSAYQDVKETNSWKKLFKNYDKRRFLKDLLKTYKVVPYDVIEKLVKIYKWDFKLFGYDPKPFLKQAKKHKNK